MEKPCEQCGVIFQKPETTSLKDWNELRKNCSRKCSTAAKKGKRATPAQIEGLRKGWELKGQQNIGNVPWNKGKEMPEETRAKVRLARSKQTNVRLPPPRYGADHHNWKGGIVPLSVKMRTTRKYKKFRKEILKRDKFTCQKCQRTDVNLETHHDRAWASIFREENITTRTEANLAESLWDAKNVVTLCHDCHEETESYRRRL